MVDGGWTTMADQATGVSVKHLGLLCRLVHPPSTMYHLGNFSRNYTISHVNAELLKSGKKAIVVNMWIS
jgi:hypothetical protein